MPRTSHGARIVPKIACLLLFVAFSIAKVANYDPLVVSPQSLLRIMDLTVKDLERQRDIPIRIYLPNAVVAAPVILFSPGLGGSREDCAYLRRHWAARGYITVFLQNPESDISVWKDKSRAKRMQALRRAANISDFLLRIRDVSAVLDQLDKWNKADNHLLAGPLNLKKVGMSGHSFGAITTQAVSGQKTRRGRGTFTDRRIVAALIMSPSSSRYGTARETFGSASIPWMLMTGRKDIPPDYQLY